jgi:peptidoglycan/LPS O-acetylase OafA/YrhL
MKTSSQSAAYRPDIEGLRGIAVLIVVAFHCGIPGFSGGFVGVDVFFVLSGYLITGLLVAEIRKTSQISLLAFYARRARRLLPASALTLVITLLIGTIILAPNELTFAGRAARATAVYMSNMFFAVNAADYFAPDVETNPLLHTWSLAVEEQFYLFWPLLIMIGLRFWQSTRALLMLLSGLTLLSLVACLWFTANGGTFAFYGLPARAWEFGIGGLAALLPWGAVRMPPAGWLALGWLGVIIILGSGSFLSPGSGFPGWIALVPVMGTAAALIAGFEQPHRGAVSVLLNSRPMQFLGALSYSWYLWHWPFLFFSAALLPGIGLGGKTTVAVLSLVVAFITHRFVENPIRFHPYLLKRAVLSLFLAAVVTIGSLGTASLAMRWADRLAHTPDMKNISAASEDIADMPREKCVTLGGSLEVKSCVFGNLSSSVNIVLFGDSHAIQWFNPLRRIAEAHGWRLTTFLKSGCPAVDVSFHADCAAWRGEAIRRVVMLRPTTVIVASATLSLGRGNKVDSPLAISLDEWRNGATRTLTTLAAARLRIVALRDTPLLAFDIPTCLARSARHSWYPGGSCVMDKSASLDPELFEAERTAAQGLPDVHFLDMTDMLCDDNLCHAVRNGAIMYRDSNHLTGSFAASLAPTLEARLLPILNAPR